MMAPVWLVEIVFLSCGFKTVFEIRFGPIVSKLGSSLFPPQTVLIVFYLLLHWYKRLKMKINKKIRTGRFAAGLEMAELHVKHSNVHSPSGCLFLCVYVCLSVRCLLVYVFACLLVG